jgi:hypothetical protein
MDWRIMIVSENEVKREREGGCFEYQLTLSSQDFQTEMKAKGSFV